MYSLQILFFFSHHSNHLVSPCCNRDTDDILYYYIIYIFNYAVNSGLIHELNQMGPFN